MTKLVLKCGDIEVEYDGPEDFLKNELPRFIKVIAELRGTKPPAAPGAIGGGGSTDVVGELSVSTIAQKLGVASGTELIIAAALSFANAGASTFTKKQLRDRVKEAKSYFKSSYASNFDNYVGRLVKSGRINHTSGENYALPAGELKALNLKLSEIT